MTSRRIAVIGVTGSGKTTIAAELARRLGYPHVELDALHWEPNWAEAPLDVFRARVAQALSGDCWVVDGNYSKVRDIIWAAADTIVWLDFSLITILWRLWWRTIRRILTREELWSGNRENLRGAFFSRDSLLAWVIKTYPRRRREYPVLLQRPEYAHLTLAHLRSPHEARLFIESINAGGQAESGEMNRTRLRSPRKGIE